MKFSILASGSTGNATFIQSEEANILVDVGLSGKRLSSLLAQCQHQLGDISAILISHEHIDHVKGLGVIARAHQIPIYITRTTYDHLPKGLGIVEEELCTFITPGEQLNIKDLTIDTIPLSHDAKGTIGFHLSGNQDRIAIVTDLGYMPQRVISQLQGVGTLIVESNHDIQMLLAGPYPWHLKQRILSDTGHLSNQASGEALCKILQGRGEQIYLAHLSQENNNPDLAALTVSSILKEEGFSDGRDFDLFVARPDCATPLRRVKSSKLLATC